jgi:uncharacterized protein (TIGR00369 family)
MQPNHGDSTRARGFDLTTATLARTLGMTVEEVSPDRCVVSMPVTEAVHQPHGVLHGGASAALAETAASVGANAACADGTIALGQEINANHLRPKRDGILRAVATPVHVGRRSQVWSIELRDEAETLICIARCTLAVLPAEPQNDA